MGKKLYGFLIVLAVGYGLYEYVYKPSLLNNFESLNELGYFLMNDNTNGLVWSESFTCMDFSVTLVLNAEELGYPVSVYTLEGEELEIYQRCFDNYAMSKGYISWWGKGDSHAICKTFVKEMDCFVYIEPQTDTILTKTNGGFRIIYGGEY